jgi:hemerythrin superfamily protein
MPMTVIEVADLTFSSRDPSTLGELLIAGKKLPPDATALLMQDHAEVKAMFRQYEMEEDKGIKAVLANKICVALTVHAQIEEEIFYPAAGEALEDDGLVNEAIEEHDEIKKKIAEIVESTVAEKSIDGDVRTMLRIVEHHVQEEEIQMFPDMRRTGVDLVELGRRLAARRAEILLRMIPSSVTTH